MIFFSSMPHLAPQALNGLQWSSTPHGQGCLHLGILPCVSLLLFVCFLLSFSFLLLLFLLPCIMKMRSSCEPCRSQMELRVSLPLLTTNSLLGSRPFLLCCYNLFGFQVLHGIKSSLLSGGVQVVCAACRQGYSVSLCPRGAPSLARSHSPLGRKGFVHGRWQLEDVSGLRRDSI